MRIPSTTIRLSLSKALAVCVGLDPRVDRSHDYLVPSYTGTLYTNVLPPALQKVAEHAPALLSWLDRCADLGLIPAKILLKLIPFPGYSGAWR